MKVVVLLLALLGSLGVAFRALGDDDTLPNFNAPVDNSPLNVDKVNRAFGIPMFQEPSLWAEDGSKRDGVEERGGDGIDAHDEGRRDQVIGATPAK